MWKISGNGLKYPSYVFGTHHFAPLSITGQVGGLQPALKEVEQVYGEIIMEEMQSPQSMQKLQQAVVLPGDTTLHTLYTPAQYDSLALKIKSMMGVDLRQMDELKQQFQILTDKISTQQVDNKEMMKVLMKSKNTETNQCLSQTSTTNMTDISYNL